MIRNGLRGEPEKPLRIGLLVDSYLQPRWVRKIVEEITHSPIAAITLVVKKTEVKDNTGFIERLLARRTHLLYDIYAWLDDKIFTVDPDAFELVSIEDLVRSVPLIEVTPTNQDSLDYLAEKDVWEIADSKLDVALVFGFQRLNKDVLNVAKYGFWSYRHGAERTYSKSPPGFWEVMNQDPTIESSLTILGEERAADRVIYRSWAPTLGRYSVKLNNNSYYWKSACFVLRKLQELYRSKDALQVVAGLTSMPSGPPVRTGIPTNYEMASVLARLAGRACFRAVEKLTSFEQWSLAYRIDGNSNSVDQISPEFRYLIPPKDRFWADPFPLKVNDKYYIFFEEFIYRDNKAHISVIQVDRNGISNGPLPVLQQDIHLSYPFVFEWQGNYYMIPETGDRDVVELYRSTIFPYNWELDKTLLAANKPLDATLLQDRERWWMFVNLQENGVAVNWDEVHLFYAVSPLGPWEPHLQNPVKSDVQSARPAGRPFFWNGAMCRPAQDSSIRYGYATTLNEIVRLSPEQYLEKEVLKILPDWDERVIGVHTVNVLDDIIAIDCLIKRRKFGSEKPLSSVRIRI